MINWTWFRTPYPFEQSMAEKRNTVVSIALFLSLIVLLLQPYGFMVINRSLLFSGYLLGAFLVLGINYFGFPILFPRWFEEAKWSISKAFLFLLYNFFIIGLWHHVGNSLFIKGDPELLISFTELLLSVSKTLMIGLVASTLLILFRFNFLARKHLQASQEVNRQLRKQLDVLHPIDPSETIQLQLENKPVTFKRSDLRYVSSEGNYIALHFMTAEKNTSKLYRGRMKEIEEALSKYPEFFRCHRSFLVNLDTIESSHGNSQGLFIKLFDTAIKIPVARPKIGFLRKRIAQKSN